MDFDRTILTDLKNRLATGRKIVVLLGPRQVGKTTLARQIMAMFGKSLYLNADLQPQHTALVSHDLRQLKLLTDGYDLLVIDEAQRIPDIGLTLKIIHDELPHLRVLVTGSSSLDLARATGEPLTGRMWQYELFPMATSELNHLGNAFEIAQHLDSFLVYGMYPEVFHYTSAVEKEEYLTNLTRAYLYKDILEVSGIRHHDKIHELLQLLAYQIGSLVSFSEIGQKLGMSTETVQRYIELLEKSYVIRRLRGFSRNLRKEITKTSKIYFLDLGIRNALIQDFKPLTLRPDRGMIWENFLFVERLKHNRYRKYFASPYFWRTYTGAELDYVEVIADELHGFEFKWGTQSRKVPKTWATTYPKATFEVINGESYHNFIGLH